MIAVTQATRPVTPYKNYFFSAWTPGSAVPLRRSAAFLSRPDTPLMPCGKRRGGPVSPGVAGRFAASHIALYSPRECTNAVFSRLPSFLCHCTAPAQLIGYNRALCRRRSAALASLRHRLAVSVAARLQLAGQRGQLGVIVLLYIYHDNLHCWPPFYTEQYHSSMHCCVAPPSGR